ncbi:MAG: phage replisome organizer N-terminal domain-containing protein [Flexilinea sp.]|nr:phage replisome organizer N-terminal domain-containing protein [Flexilinea sp.]
MGKVWIKLYTETIHDRKMWRLKPIEQLTFFYLLILAGIEDDCGRLPGMDDIELELQMPLKQTRTGLEKIIDTLADSGLIDVRDGVMYVTNYESRQKSSMTEAEKKAVYREKQRTKNGQQQDTCPDICPTDVQKMSTVEEELRIKNKELRIKNTEIKNTDLRETDKSVNNFNGEIIEKNAKTDVFAPEIFQPTKNEKPKLTPDDHDFWKFAKENTEMAEEFYRISGIYPVKKEFGRWVNDLRDLAEAGITIADMQKAVEYMRGQNISIGAPGSILKTARWLKANPQAAAAKSPHRESWTERAERIAAELNFDGFNFGNKLPEGDVIDL